MNIEELKTYLQEQYKKEERMELDLGFDKYLNTRFEHYKELKEHGIRKNLLKEILDLIK